MFKKFLSDKAGNFAPMAALLMIPVLGTVALAVDYTQVTRQRQITLNALDAAGIATAKRIAAGATDAEAEQFASDFFYANLSGVKKKNAQLHVDLPNSSAGGGILKLSADLTYNPIFFGAFQGARGKEAGAQKIDFKAVSEIRLKNTLEVALVLDNSGSMNYYGKGSSSKRLSILKGAAKELVETIAKSGAQMTQVINPVQFALVPFAASVNVGPGNASADWMDTLGLSPIHHENFDWSTLSDPDKRVEKTAGAYYTRGAGWGTDENKPMTRFTLFNSVKRVTKTERKKTSCRKWKRGRCKKWNYEKVPVDWKPVSSWSGCVEMRPYPHSVQDTAPKSAEPETLFVPMFAPDETDTRDGWNRPSNNNWWTDHRTGSALKRQQNAAKYFEATDENVSWGPGEGPNLSCTTKPITPLTEVSMKDKVKSAGLQKIEAAIEEMEAGGATNVTEGIAWGWRVVSGRAPFTEGRADHEKGNDKVVIVLTDGANTYYTPGSISVQSYSGDGGGNDEAGNKSIYSNLGYASKRRIFDGTSGVSKSDYSNSNYTKAMTSQMDAVCQNAKAGNIILMTVALDLSTSDSTEKKQIEALKECASESRFRKDANGKPAKLFWNATSGNLDEQFKKIADELSNLRIVG